MTSSFNPRCVAEHFVCRLYRWARAPGLARNKCYAIDSEYKETESAKRAPATSQSLVLQANGEVVRLRDELVSTRRETEREASRLISSEQRIREQLGTLRVQIGEILDTRLLQYGGLRPDTASTVSAVVFEHVGTSPLQAHSACLGARCK